jgi:hypothetical protein
MRRRVAGRSTREGFAMSSRHRYGWSLAVALALAAVAAIARPAGAVQASGSLLVIPSSWGYLAVDEEIDIAIHARNSSMDTPAASFPDPLADVGAVIGGPITVTLACADPLCAAQVPGKLAFVKVGASGCVAKNPAVNACVAGPGTTVLVDFASIDLPPGGTVEVATIRVKVVDLAGVTQLGINARTDPGSLIACSTSAPAVCATCTATGCTKVVAVQGINIAVCSPSKIRFIGTAAKPDALEFHANVSPGGLIDPPNQPFSVKLGNVLFDPILSFTLPPGSFKKQGTTYTYRDDSASTTGGIGFVRISLRDNQPNVYKVDIQAYDASLEAEAVVPAMTVEIAIGSETFSLTAPWVKKDFGWQLSPSP